MTADPSQRKQHALHHKRRNNIPMLTPIFPRVKIKPSVGYDTSKKVAIYAAPDLLDNGAKMKGNLEGGIGITVENDGVLWITFDAC